MKYASLLLFIIFLCSPAYAGDESIPNARLRVAVQQKSDGKLENGFHVLDLSCWNGQCSLSSVSLNQCFQLAPDRKAFYPTVQYSSTRMQNLKVRNEKKSLVVQETGSDAFGDYVNNFYFDYEPASKGEIITRLVGFSGGYIKSSDFLKKVLTVEYVALPKAEQFIKLDCDIILPGIDKR